MHSPFDYKLPIKNFESERLKHRKKEIIEILTRLRKETGWLLNIPNANFGDISDGDRSRRFFWRFKIYLWRNKLQLSPNILLKNHTGDNFKWHTLDPEKFEKYAFDTAR